MLRGDGKNVLFNQTRRTRLFRGKHKHISSPFTRALHTAAILSKELSLDIIVETDLHEWMANKDYIYVDDETAKKNYYEYVDNKDYYPEGESRDWETAAMMKERFINVLKKYKNYDNVIVTCHGMIMEAVTGMHHPKYGEIFELEMK